MKTIKKTCLITGGSSGIGKAIAAGLAKENMHVILIARNTQELESAREEITTLTGNTDVEAFAVDLSLQSNIREFVKMLKTTLPKLDILINNAGVNLPERRLTPEGMEVMFAVNHLAPFLLTNLLTDMLKAAASSMVINIVSNGEKYARFDPDNLQGEKKFNAMKQYCLSKLCNLMFSYEFARRSGDSGITSNAIHPGGVRTSIMKEYSLFSLPGLVWMFLYPRLNKPGKVASYLLDLIRNGTLVRENGNYYFKGRVYTSSPDSTNTRYAADLWKISEELTGIRYGFSGG